MSVVIDEVTTEVREDVSRSASEVTSGGGGGGARGEPDLDRLDYLMRRARHRVLRLWAD